LAFQRQIGSAAPRGSAEPPSGASGFGSVFTDHMVTIRYRPDEQCPALRRAVSSGYDRVVFRDAARHRYVEELGGMNIFFVFREGRIATPPLLDTVLAGVTRVSVITLAEEAGHRVVEAPYTVEQWRDGAATGQLREVFACGTAATIVGIDRVRYLDEEFTVGDGGVGPITAGLRTRLLDLQYGRATDVRNWIRVLP
jgi:branched-chain amino acid aminotransferase